LREKENTRVLAKDSRVEAWRLARVISGEG
jgi:hypothetical protein